MATGNRRKRLRGERGPHPALTRRFPTAVGKQDGGNLIRRWRATFPKGEGFGVPYPPLRGYFPTAVGKQGGRRITAPTAAARLSKRLPLWGS